MVILSSIQGLKFKYKQLKTCVIYTLGHISLPFLQLSLNLTKQKKN